MFLFFPLKEIPSAPQAVSGLRNRWPIIIPVPETNLMLLCCDQLELEIWAFECPESQDSPILQCCNLFVSNISLLVDVKYQS